MAITTIKIFPPIGIARLGNSPEFFIGPELPGDRTPPANGYKDASCRVKRQAARFRLFGYDGGGNLVQEITNADGAISWTVHVANKKSSWKSFNGLAANTGLRNAGVANRATLEIDPGPRTLNGPDEAAGFNTGTFLGKAVALGEMRTDSAGRLIVLGGFGRSESVPPGIQIVDYANNNGWHDDVADGPVTATVTLTGGGGPIVATPGWVLCVPPDFSPPVDSVTTLYDLMFQKSALPIPATPSFTNDIYPILGRVIGIKRLNSLAATGHFSFSAAFSGASAAQRQSIFGRIRNPNSPTAAGAADMPRLWDDSHQTFQVVTKSQYAILTKWKDGTFADDWTGSPAPAATMITPDGLTRAALEACVGGGLYPGIEASWMLRDTYAISEPFRLDHTGRSPGDVTKQMAVPWQADFHDCYAYSIGGPVEAWWPAQRPDDVFPEAGGGPVAWIRDIVDPGNAGRLDMVNHWFKLGFVVDKGGSLVETERRKVCSNIFLITDRSTFSEDEVAAVLLPGAPDAFENSLYVVAEAFLPSELGVTKPNPTLAELAPIAPVVTIRRSDGNLAPGMSAVPRELLLEDPSLPATQRQRFTFVYRVEFTNTSAFSVGGMPVETQVLDVTATKGGYNSAGNLTLLRQPNPYMIDGQTSWLSVDLRVFKVTEGDLRFGSTMGANAAAASTYIKQVVDSFNTLGPAGHPFESISTDQAASRLELAQSVSGKRIFNFAIARVRYRASALPATSVRVFFRLFTTAATGLDYNQSSTYRRTAGPAPSALLGLQGGEIVTIPCYGEARVDTTTVALSTQTDEAVNERTIQPAANPGDESFGYFGAWLDFNQTTPRFPNHPTPTDGPWTTNLRSIQELIRGMHQCLVAEVFFSGDPIPVGASPAANDNLAQRNLAIDDSDNPGGPSTRIVQHTFEIKATNPQAELVVPTAEDVAIGAFGEVALAQAGEARVVPAGPDELMIRWNDLPPQTDVTIYMPDVDANEVVRYAGQNYEDVRLEAVDPHTIRSLPGDVTFVPLPTDRSRNIPALLTIELPDGVRKGQVFDVVVHQVSGRPRAVLGAFQFTIPVSTKAVLLEPEIRKLSVLRHIALAIPAEDPWRLVFTRYLDQIADRVRGFGGNPDRVAPSPDGTGRDPVAERCARLGWLVAGLLALLVAVAGWHPSPTFLPEIVVLVALVAAAVYWASQCAPSLRRWIVSGVVGLAIGSAVLAVLWFVGLAAAFGPTVLVIALVALALLVIVGLYERAFTLEGA